MNKVIINKFKSGALKNYTIVTLFYALILLGSPNHKYFDTHLFYISIILISSIIASLSDLSKNKKTKGFILIIAIAIIAVPFIFRDMMGTDDPVYFNLFRLVSIQGFIDRFIESTMEPGYLFINYICSLFTSDYLFCQIICATLPFIIIYCALIKEQSIIFYYFALIYISSFLYFHILEAAIVRMFIAISIVLYSYRFLIYGETKKYFITIIIAMMFHYSSGIMLLFSMFTIKERYYAKHPLKITILIAVICIIGVFLISYLAMNILGPRYAAYILDESEYASFSIMQLDTFPFFLYGLWFSKNIPKRDKATYNIFLVMILFSSLISCISLFLPIGRIIYYFNMALIFLVSYWYRYSSNLLKWLMSGVFTFYCLLYVEVTKLSIITNHLYPYKGVLFSVM